MDLLLVSRQSLLKGLFAHFLFGKANKDIRNRDKYCRDNVCIRYICDIFPAIVHEYGFSIQNSAIRVRKNGSYDK